MSLVVTLRYDHATRVYSAADDSPASKSNRYVIRIAYASTDVAQVLSNIAELATEFAPDSQLSIIIHYTAQQALSPSAQEKGFC